MGRVRTTGKPGRAVCLVICLFSVILAASCSETGATPKPAPSELVTLTIGYPHVTGQDVLYGMQQAARLVSLEGLVLSNRNGRVQPRLAESWAESSDGLVWNFKLRQNAFFHDGTRVDASAVKASLERSLGSADIAQYPGLSDIVAIEAPGPDEIVIRLRSRSTFLLDDLGVSIVKVVPGSASVGTGPYVTLSATGSELVMTGFPKYYRGDPRIDRVVWKAYPAVRTAWAAMMRGEIDFLYEVGPEALEFIQSENSVQVFSSLRNYVHGVLLNAKRAPFQDSTIRRALNYAVDRPALITQALKGHGIAADGPAWPPHWAYDSTAGKYSYDPSRAIALLDVAHVPAADAHPAPDTPPGRLHFTCLVPENFTVWERMALIVQRRLSEVGVNMIIESIPFGELNQRISTGNFDAVMMEVVVGNTVSRSYFFWHSQGQLNFWGYRNPRMDSALDGIRRAPTEGQYREAFRRFQTESLDDPPAIFLALGEIARAVSKRFEVIAPPGNDILPTISDWRPAEPGARMTN